MKKHSKWAFQPLLGNTSRFLLVMTLCLVTAMSVFAQTKSITGKVTDLTGEPMPGVTVIEKGTSNGTVTNVGGDYSLTVSNKATQLQFSFVGMKTKEIEISTKTQINVTLQEETIGLDEVVAIGYGVQKKSNITGAISSVKGEELASSLGSNAASAIQGRVSGVQVVNNSGAPGATPILRVRGYSSNGSSDPLYIVDV